MDREGRGVQNGGAGQVRFYHYKKQRQGTDIFADNQETRMMRKYVQRNIFTVWDR